MLFHGEKKDTLFDMLHECFFFIVPEAVRKAEEESKKGCVQLYRKPAYSKPETAICC